MRWVQILGASLWVFGAGLAQAQDAGDAKRWLEQGKLIEAGQAYTALIQAHPSDPDHWLGRGLTQVRQGQWRACNQ